MVNKKEIDKIMEEHIEDELVLNIAKRINADLFMRFELPEKRNLLHWTDKNWIAGAITYMAFIKVKRPKSLDEIGFLFNINRTKIGRTYRKIKNELGVHYCQKEETGMMSTTCTFIVQPIDYMGEFSGELNEKEKKILKTILQHIEESKDFGSQNPKSIFAAAYYIAKKTDDDQATQRNISYKFMISEAGLRVLFHKIMAMELKEHKNKIEMVDHHRKKEETWEGIKK